MPGPLDGIRIVDLTTMASGPLATSILADQGADVIKVEAPDRGDALRTIGPSRGGLSALFTSLNRNKRSIAIDLHTPRGVALLDRLVARADVFIQNFRPGAVDRMGVGADRYRALHPELIYVSISGFGERGPMVNRGVYDSLMQAYVGVAVHQADLETGEPQFVRSVVCDKGTAIQTSQLVTAALLARARGAGGQHLKISMLHASLAFLWPDGMQNYTLLGDGVSAPLMKSALPMIRPTADGHIAISYIQDREFAALCRALGRDDLARDERFEKADPRARHGRELQGLLDETLRRFTTAELLAAARRGGRAACDGRGSGDDPSRSAGRGERARLRDGSSGGGADAAAEAARGVREDAGLGPAGGATAWGAWAGDCKGGGIVHPGDRRVDLQSHLAGVGVGAPHEFGVVDRRRFRRKQSD